MSSTSFKQKLGHVIQKARLSRGLTQAELAKELSTSQSAINRIERGGQNVSLEMIARIGEVLSSDIVSINRPGTINFRVHGGKKLSGSIRVNTSKNAAVALLCASLLNRGKTTFRKVARIEEVNRIIEVLNSIGVKTIWLEGNDLEIIPPRRLKLEDMDIKAAERTRTVIMFLGPLLHYHSKFQLPFAGGCNLGTRTVEPHLAGLKHFGLSVKAYDNYYDVHSKKQTPKRPIILIERGDTVTENILLAAALTPGTTTIRNASANYMVQDICFFLQKLGVKIDGIGSSTLRITGVSSIDKNVSYSPSEDPIEAMSFLSAAIVTKSEITIQRAPIEFLEIELQVLEHMGFEYELSREYKADNGSTRLVDITTRASQLSAAQDKLHSVPFPGVNMDNLPFLGLIAATAKGRSLLHDWVYENRAIYLTELTKLGANIQLLDPHRVTIEGATKWQPAELIAPPALRPSVVILLAMLAAPGTSILRNIYSIARGYEDLAARLNTLGADIELFREI
jgi:UDP-N-acetylglucosamine 1-carboxyvinyltransferase